MKKKLLTALKIALSIGLVIFVLSQIETKRLLELLKSSDPLWLFGAFLLFNASKIVSSLRLNIYFKHLGIYLGELEALRLYYVGMFYNLFLPGGIGGDGYKVYLLQKRHNAGYKGLIAATLLDRISGLAALLFLAGVLFLYSRYAELFPWLKLLDIAALIALFPLYFYLHKKLFRSLSEDLSKTTFLAFVVQLLQLLSAYAIFKALGLNDHTIEYLTLFLVSSVVAVLPLTIGGVGAREFTFLYGLKILGLDPSAGVAFSFLFFLITLLSSAIGLFFLHRPLTEDSRSDRPDRAPRPREPR